MGRKKIYESREEAYKAYYAKNKEKARIRSKKYNEENPEKAKEYWEKFKKGDKYGVANKKWNRENKDRKQRLEKEKRQNSPILRLQDSVSSAVNYYLKTKSQKTNEYLGCSYEEYFVYLDGLLDENMSWDNYGTYWEIDHTIPLSKGGSFHYTNTTPMPISENRSKSNKLNV